jgi:hypothetical protein
MLSFDASVLARAVALLVETTLVASHLVASGCFAWAVNVSHTRHAFVHRIAGRRFASAIYAVSTLHADARFAIANFALSRTERIIETVRAAIGCHIALAPVTVLVPHTLNTRAVRTTGVNALLRAISIHDATKWLLVRLAGARRVA